MGHIEPPASIPWPVADLLSKPSLCAEPQFGGPGSQKKSAQPLAPPHKTSPASVETAVRDADRLRGDALARTAAELTVAARGGALALEVEAPPTAPRSSRKRRSPSMGFGPSKGSMHGPDPSYEASSIT
jgi:hypothetical protein